MSIAAKLVRNSAVAVIGRLWLALTMFVLLPFMVRTLGNETLGIFFVSLAAVTAYFAVIDIGVGLALTRFVADFHARRDYDQLNEVVNTGAAFYALNGIIGAIPVLLLERAFLVYIHTPAEMMPQAISMFHWILGSSVFMAFGSAFRGPLIGLHRLDLFNTVDIVVSVPYVVLTMWLLKSGYGLPGIGFAQFVQSFLPVPVLLAYTVRLTPNLRLNPLRGTRRMFVTMMGYGWKAAVPSVAVLVQNQAEKLMITRMVGPAALTLYTFGAKLVEVWRSVFAPIFIAVMPAASGLGAVEGAAKLYILYVRATKFTLAILYGMGLCLFILAPILMTGWMGAGYLGHHVGGRLRVPSGKWTGAGYGVSMQAMRYLLVAAMINMSAGVASAVARGLSQLRPDLVASAVMVVVQLAAGAALGLRYGYVGILTASILSLGFNAVVYVIMVHRTFHWPIASFAVKVYIAPLLVAGVAAAPMGWFNHVHKVAIVSSGATKPGILRLAGLGFIETAAFVGLYSVLLFATRYVKPDEFRSLRSAVGGARHAHVMDATVAVEGDVVV